MKQNRRQNSFCPTDFRARALRVLAGRGDVRDAKGLQGAKNGSCPAAVLVPIVDHGDTAWILLTKRADDHPHHAGQISFPGGKMAAQDQNIAAAALRETFEETGIEARHIELVGHLAPHETSTGFTIYPVVGLLTPVFTLKPCSREVSEIFEVPLSFVMNKDNYQIEEIEWQGQLRKFYVMNYGSRRIWGATAAILKNLQERIYLP